MTCLYGWPRTQTESSQKEKKMAKRYLEKLSLVIREMYVKTALSF